MNIGLRSCRVVVAGEAGACAGHIWGNSGIERQQLLHQAAAGRGHQPQFAGVVLKRRVEHPRLLQKVAVDPQRRDHIAGVVGDLGQALALTAHIGQSLNHRHHTLALIHGDSGQSRYRQPSSSQTGFRHHTFFEFRCQSCLLHKLLLLFRGQRSGGSFLVPSPSSLVLVLPIPAFQDEELSCSNTRSVPN